MKVATAVWHGDETFSISLAFPDDASDVEMVSKLCKVGQEEPEDLYQVLVYTNGGEGAAPEIHTVALGSYTGRNERFGYVSTL